MKKIALILFLALGCEDQNLGYIQVPCSATDPNRVGAVCKDGISRKGTASNVCGSHGGVDKWICDK